MDFTKEISAFINAKISEKVAKSKVLSLKILENSNILTLGTAWSLRTPKNYSEGSGCWEVVWKGIFMPFDVICGLDGCPPDNEDYTKYKKTHWWVCPKTKHDVCNVHDISMFIDLPHSKEFKKLEDAINYCLNWRKEWLKRELSKADRY